MKSRFIALLIWSERYTKTNMTYLVGQSSWLLIGQGAIFTSSLFLAWVFANYVSPSDYGLYKFVISIATLATITSLTGIGIAVARSVAQGNEVNLFKVLKLQIRFGVIGTAGLFILALYYVYKDNTLLASLFAVTAIWIPFYESLGNYQFLLQGKKDFKTQTYLRLVQRLLLSISLVFVIFYTKNIILITLSYFALQTISQYIVFKYTTKKHPATNDGTTSYHEIVSYGKQLSFQNIFFIGAGQLDKIIMFKFLGPAQLAIYFFAVALPNEIQGVLGNINAVAFPKLVNQVSPTFKFALLKKIGLFTIILLLPALAYVLAAPYLFSWLFPVYLDAVFLSQLYIGTILFIPASLLWHYFYAIEDRPALWFGTFVGPSVFILGILFLVPVYGLLGAVIATYVRNVVDLGSGLYFFLRQDRKVR